MRYWEIANPSAASLLVNLASQFLQGSAFGVGESLIGLLDQLVEWSKRYSGNGAVPSVRRTSSQPCQFREIKPLYKKEIKPLYLSCCLLASLVVGGGYG